MAENTWATACWCIRLSARPQDDAERAMRAGVAAVEAVRGIGAADPLEVRIDIATGLVGDLVGEGPSQEQAVVGETPNLSRPAAGAGRARRRGDCRRDTPAPRQPVPA